MYTVDFSECCSWFGVYQVDLRLSKVNPLLLWERQVDEKGGITV